MHNWPKKADIEDGHRPGLTESERVELRELKKRNRLLEQENEVLRKAAAYLSQANLYWPTTASMDRWAELARPARMPPWRHSSASCKRTF